MLGKIGAVATKSSLLKIWSSKSHAVGCWRMFPRIMEVIRLLQTPFAESFLHVVWKDTLTSDVSEAVLQPLDYFHSGTKCFFSIHRSLGEAVGQCLQLWVDQLAVMHRHQDMWSTDQAFALKYRFKYRFPCPALYKDCQDMPNNVFRWSNRYDGIEQGIWAMLLWSL